MALQPLAPVLIPIVFFDVVGDRPAVLGFGKVFDIKAHLDRLPRFEAEVDDLDLARSSRLRRLLQGLVDHRARCVGVMDAEDLDRLAMRRELVDQIARRAGREALRGHDGAVVFLQPAVLLQRIVRALLLDVEELVEQPCGPLVFLDHQRAERDHLVAVRMDEASARIAVHETNLAVLVLVVVEDRLEVADLEFLPESPPARWGAGGRTGCAH